MLLNLVSITYSEPQSYSQKQLNVRFSFPIFKILLIVSRQSKVGLVIYVRIHTDIQYALTVSHKLTNLYEIK